MHTRREFLRIAAASGVVTPLVAAGPAAPVTAAATRLAAYAVGPQVWIKNGPEVVLCYRAHPSQKYPYIYPVAGPASGLPLTTESGDPHPHHRSMFFACDQVNGVDFWHPTPQPHRIVSAGPAAREHVPDTIEITDSCAWTAADGKELMRDTRVIRVSRPKPGLTLIDWDITWSAVAAISIPRTNHSLFAIRAAHDITPAGGGVLLDAEGRSGEKETFGKAAAWCGFHGRRLGKPDAAVEGICLLVHPANPFGRCPWFTRDYGFASPTQLYFSGKPWQLPAGQSVRLRHLVVAHAGTPAEAGIDALHAAWSRAG